MVKKYEWLILLPLSRSIADLVETISYISLVKIFPNGAKFLVYTASVFTSVKWFFMFATLLTLIVLLGLNLFKVLKEKEIKIFNYFTANSSS